jgi:hypothetical protein
LEKNKKINIENNIHFNIIFQLSIQSKKTLLGFWGGLERF